MIHHAVTKELDYEVELAVVIGTGGKDIARADALKHVFGYTVINDVTARDLQRIHGQWFKGKSLDTFCPIGPWIVHKSALPNPQQVRLICRVNGEVMQDGNTRDLIFDIPTLVAHVSSVMTLLPGDVILTGTPEGVGPMQVGDEVEISIAGIGTLTNKVALR